MLLMMIVMIYAANGYIVNNFKISAMLIRVGDIHKNQYLTVTIVNLNPVHSISRPPTIRFTFYLMMMMLMIMIINGDDDDE